MTFEEAKKILEKEFAVIGLHKSTEPFEFDESGWIEHEKPSVLEAFRVLSKEGYYITISGHDYNMREKRLKKEYEENTKAPGSAENSIKGDLSGNKSIEHCGEPIPGSPLSAVEGIKLKRKDNQNTSENHALAESATQFNDALLDEQAKKIAELTKENERLERVSKTTTDEFNKLYYRMITKSDKIDAQALKSAESALAYKEKVIADLTHKLKDKHKRYVWHKGAYLAAQQILNTIADYAAKHPDKKFSDQMVQDAHVECGTKVLVDKSVFEQIMKKAYGK